jgi:hypothetical protein
MGHDFFPWDCIALIILGAMSLWHEWKNFR